MLGTNLEKCFKLIEGKNIEDVNENYSDILPFTHEDFLNLDYTANEIGRVVAALKLLADKYHVDDLPKVIIEAGKQSFPLGNLSYADAKNLFSKENENHLSSALEILIHKAEKLQPYGEISYELYPLLEKFAAIFQAGVLVMDQTNFVYGGSSLQYFSHGKNTVPIDPVSGQPTLSASIIVGQKGARKTPMASCWPNQSKDPKKNAQMLRGMHNGKHAIPKEARIWFTESGACDGTVMAEWAWLELQTMIDFSILFIYDAIKCNDDSKVLTVLEEKDSFESIVPSHMTGPLASPDDKAMDDFKNGTSISNGVKIDVSHTYKRIGEFAHMMPPKNPYVKVNKPMDIKTAWHIAEKNYNAIDDTTLMKSNLRVGNAMMINLPRQNVYGLKTFMQLALLVDPESLKQQEQNSISPLEIRSHLEVYNQHLQKEKKTCECLADGCNKRFKTLREQMDHTRVCSKWTKYPFFFLNIVWQKTARTFAFNFLFLPFKTLHFLF